MEESCPIFGGNKVFFSSPTHHAHSHPAPPVSLFFSGIKDLGRDADRSPLPNIEVNPLKTNRRLLYLKTQSVPRCKHFSSRL